MESPVRVKRKVRKWLRANVQLHLPPHYILIHKWEEDRKDRYSYCAYRIDLQHGAIIYLKHGARLRPTYRMDIHAEPPAVWTMGHGLTFLANKARAFKEGVGALKEIYELSYEREVQGKIIHKIPLGTSDEAGRATYQVYFWIQNMGGKYWYKIQLFALEPIQGQYQATQRYYMFPMQRAEYTLKKLEKVFNDTIDLYEERARAKVEVPKEMEDWFYVAEEIEGA